MLPSSQSQEVSYVFLLVVGNGILADTSSFALLIHDTMVLTIIPVFRVHRFILPTTCHSSVPFLLIKILSLLQDAIHGTPGWLSGWAPTFSSGGDPGIWNLVPHRAPCGEPASHSAYVSASLFSQSVSLMNK